MLIQTRPPFRYSASDPPNYRWSEAFSVWQMPHGIEISADVAEAFQARNMVRCFHEAHQTPYLQGLGATATYCAS